jgi:hypothetical protein
MITPEKNCKYKSILIVNLTPVEMRFPSKKFFFFPDMKNVVNLTFWLNKKVKPNG